jgi:hypothetical protein
MADLHELERTLREYMKLCDDALGYARRAALEHAETDDAYRTKLAQVFVTAKDDGATDAKAKHLADAATEGVRKRARLAADMQQVSIEAVRSRRTQISALQSLLAAHKSEAELSKFGPGVTP